MKKTISKGKIWCFAIGQLGWSILSALISSWLVNYYQPDTATIESGHALFVPQGAIFLGMTIIGLITAFGRVFDAVTDPIIASASDRITVFTTSSGRSPASGLFARTVKYISFRF